MRKLSRKKQLLFYWLIFLLGLLAFILEIFVFQKPDGVLGLVICLASLFSIIFGSYKLCRSSEKIKNFFIHALDILLGLP